jgi:hypothetical protein
MVFGAISYNWKSELVILRGTGKRKGVTAHDYLVQVLKPVIAPAFCCRSGYCGVVEGGQ